MSLKRTWRPTGFRSRSGPRRVIDRGSVSEELDFIPERRRKVDAIDRLVTVKASFSVSSSSTNDEVVVASLENAAASKQPEMARAPNSRHRNLNRVPLADSENVPSCHSKVHVVGLHGRNLSFYNGH